MILTLDQVIQTHGSVRVVLVLLTLIIRREHVFISNLTSRKFQIYMPFKRLKRTHRYDVSTKNALLILVELLDQKEIECSVSIDSPAQECLDIVLNRLQVQSEGFYFGLQYLNKQKHR